MSRIKMGETKSRKWFFYHFSSLKLRLLRSCEVLLNISTTIYFRLILTYMK